jgi:hypothetical protein
MVSINARHHSAGAYNVRLEIGPASKTLFVEHSDKIGLSTIPERPLGLMVVMLGPM